MTTTRHVSFSVTNLERTVEFYIDVLGLPILIQFRNKYHTLGDIPLVPDRGITIRKLT